MDVLFTNNASSTLVTAIDAVTTTLLIQEIEAAKFPLPMLPEHWFPVTVVDKFGGLEIMVCTARNLGTLTVERGKEGTVARAFVAGSRVDHRLTAGAIIEISGSVNIGWDNVTGKPATYPPTLPIAQSGITNLTADQAAQDTAIAEKLPAVNYTALDVMGKVQSLDGSGSGLDADLLDGLDGSYYLSFANLTNTPTGFPPADHGHPQSDIEGLEADLDGLAPLDSPLFTGDPRAPTTAPTDDSTSLATTSFVQNKLLNYNTKPEAAALVALVAPLDSPALTGIPTAPTAPALTNTLQIATTAFVTTANAVKAPIANPVFTGDPQAPTPTAGDNDTSIATTAFVTTAVAGKVGEAPGDGKQYARKSYQWAEVTVPTGGASVYIGDGPPASPVAGQLWWESDGGNMFVWYNDGNTTQWVPANTGTMTPGAGGGSSGSLILSGAGAPADALGNVGDYYVDTTNQILYGPKKTGSSGLWPIAVQGGAPVNSPTFTGDPKAPTAAPGDNDTSIATTAFVKAAVDAVGGGATPSNTAPLVNGTAAAGSMVTYSRGDHIHPTDTTRLQATAYNAADVLTKIKTVDGPASGLDADLLDGLESTAFAPVVHTHSYASLTGVPATFTPSAHGHTTGEITGLDAALTGKAAAVHTHAQSDVTNLVTDLAGKAPTSHTHTTAQVTGLDTALAGKSDTSHTHSYSSLTGIPSTFAPSAHSHPTSEITGLDAALAGKSDTGHTHSYSSLTSIPSTFAPSAHTHPQSEVTNLVTDLAAKASTTYVDARTPKITVASSAPGSPATGDVWIDTT